ncbi:MULTISPECIES: TolC family protein [unclassified Lentilitoribacter]|uniref:TolC family protein n=1 Tax=unclassified Lentilitoribacter TaxID=2647570 RepID=UPI0013A6B519|nr:TolC family protein [Lentilitoribacter sp. Alg239-R112]
MRQHNLRVALTLALFFSSSVFVDADPDASATVPQATQMKKPSEGLRGILNIFKPTRSETRGSFKPYKPNKSDKFLPTKEVVGSIATLTSSNEFGKTAEKSGLIGLEMRGLITNAIASSDAIDVSKSEVKIAQIRIWKELASYTPVISMSVDVSRAGLRLGTIPHGQETSELKFSLNLPIFTSGRRHFALKAAKSNRKAALGRAKAVRNQVASQVISALLQFNQAQQTVALLGENVGSLKRLLTAVRNREKQGFASAADIAYVQANLASLRRQREGSISTRNQIKAQLESLIGAPVDKTPKLPALKKLIQSTENELVAQAIISDPTLMAAKHTATAQRFASRSAIGGYLPQVSLYGQHDVALGTYTKSKQTTDWEVGVRLTMPLVDLATVADISEAKERAQLASYQASDTRRNVELSVRSLSREYQSAVKQVGLANSRVNYLRKVAKSEAVKYEKGVGTLDKVLEQKQILAQARIDASDTKTSAYWAAYQLLIASGRFEGGSFGLSDRILLSQLR